MIGQQREKQVDGVRSGVALLLRPPENSDPPGRQAAVSAADAQHHAAPGFCKGSCECGRHDRDSEAVSDKLHGDSNFAYLERCGALEVMLGKYFIDESSEGAVARQVDKDLIGECLDGHAAARGQRVIAWADGYERILHIGNELNAGPLIFVDDRIEAKVDLPGSEQPGDRVAEQDAYRYIDHWKCGTKALQEGGQFKIWVEALHNAKAQSPANDSILGANCLHGALERSECRTSMLQKKHTCLSNGDLARGAFDEPRPEFFFQFLNRV